MTFVQSAESAPHRMDDMPSLRIALTADPELPVPPRHYGGIERIVDMLARGLTARGHEVTLFAHGESSTAAHLVPWPGRTSHSKLDTLRNAATLSAGVIRGRFDLVHSFSRVGYLAPILPMRIPKLMTYQRDISARSVSLGHRLSKGSLQFSAISKVMMGPVADLATWNLVYNGVPLSVYDWRPEVPADAPVVFLGRIEEIKGPHLAIEAARQAGVPLVIAGNVVAEHQAWFESNIEPHLDGVNVSFIGPVDDVQKNKLLGSARAFLMPILWEEPFGIVMAEAMACGTPVIGFPRGAVPEIVDDNVTGFIVASVEEMASAILKVQSLDRKACRTRVESMFSEVSVVEGYLAVYRRMLEPARADLPA